MSYQEKKSIVYLVSTLILTGVYWLVIYNNHYVSGMSTDALLKFWAIRVLWFIPISIAMRIVVTIIYTIFNSIANEVKGNEPDDVNLVDERDKLIELKTTQISLVVFSIGFVTALLNLALGNSVNYFFIYLLGFGVLSEVFSSVFTVYYYRKGV